ncbi:hypothetical protein TNCV_2539561 [Trichonephila clavipes]|nr:hypothetical protein TNCV_2539561 [Trichonephila clavipes]
MYKHPCLLRDLNPGPTEQQSASLTTIPDGLLNAIRSIFKATLYDAGEILLQASLLYDAPTHSSGLSLRLTSRFAWTLTFNVIYQGSR